MPNPNAIVGIVARIDPPLREPAADLLRKSALTIEFADGRRGRLDPADRRSAGFAEVIDDLRQRRRPAYVEIDPATGRIERLRLPRVTHIEALTSTAAGDVIVEIPYSHAGHVLRRSSPDFADWEALLRASLAERRPVLLTDDDRHDIIDLRWYPNPEEPIPLPKPGLPPERWWRWPWKRLPIFIKVIESWVKAWLAAVTPAQAQQLFALVSATSCDPLTVPPPCIPFLYPDNGCWARAHEMCRLMINAGVTPRKVWNYGSQPMSLHVGTKNHPDCTVSWNWHVAPTLNVRGPMFFQVDEHVIDPALFPGPVLTSAWRAAQADLSSQLIATDATAYYRWKNGTIDLDPTYSETNAWLADMRNELKVRSLTDGPPPYPNCP